MTRDSEANRVEDTVTLRDNAFLENIEKDFYDPLLEVLHNVQFPRMKDYTLDAGDIKFYKGFAGKWLKESKAVDVTAYYDEIGGTKKRGQIGISIQLGKLSIDKKRRANLEIEVISSKRNGGGGSKTVVAHKTFKYKWEREKYSSRSYDKVAKEVLVWINSELRKKNYIII